MLTGSAKNQEKIKLPSNGISIRQLRNFVTEYSGELNGKSTEQVVLLIKERTKGHFSSYIEWLVHVGRGSDITPATVFVSHAWSDPFLDLISSLELKYGSVASHRFWIDAFVISQNVRDRLTEGSPGALFEETQELIKSIGTVAVILTPFEKPSCLTRSWCLFEFFSALKERANIVLLVPLSERYRLIEFLFNGDDITQLYRNIDAASAEARWPCDRLEARARVLRELGVMGRLDELVSARLRGWLAEEARTVHALMPEAGRADGALQRRLGLALAEQVTQEGVD